MTDSAAVEARLLLVEFERRAARVMRLALAEHLIVMTAVVVPAALCVIGGQIAFAGNPAAAYFKAAGVVFLVSIVAAVPVRIMLAWSRGRLARHATLISQVDLLRLGRRDGDTLGPDTISVEGGTIHATRTDGRWAYISRVLKITLALVIAGGALWVAWSHFVSGSLNRVVIGLGSSGAVYAALALILLRINDVLAWRYDADAGTLSITRLHIWLGRTTRVHDLTRATGVELKPRGIIWKRLAPIVRLDDGSAFPLPVPAIEVSEDDRVVSVAGLIAYTRCARIARAIGFELDKMPEARTQARPGADPDDPSPAGVSHAP